MVTGVDFVTVPTQDFETAEKFYTDVLQLERSKQWGDMPAREFEAGNLTIAIMQMDAFGREFKSGSAAIALHVDDVEAERKRLEDAGVEFQNDTLDSGVCHMAFFQDPDGNAFILHNRYAPKDAKPGDA
jgi:predicted enzyme related to lactoylglutathione lyase